VADVIQLEAQPILARDVAGEALASDIPLSFWGGYDPDRGAIIDQRHPLAGQLATGRVLVIPFGRGSCSGSGVLLEAIRNGAAPAAIVTSHLDPIISLGAVLGEELYSTFPAILVIPEAQRHLIATGDFIEIATSGHLTVHHAK
jgi:predicted aconitase with swiveling domain